MKSKDAVSFRIYYFLELLSQIREQGQKNYDENSFATLQTFLDFIDSKEDLQVAIEELAAHAETSDLAIFFSDLLEHLNSLPPETTLGQVADPAGDFLDIFKVYLQQEGWGASVEAKLSGAVEEVPVEVVEEAGSEVSFHEYFRHVLDSNIREQASELPERLQGPYSRYLEDLADAPELLEQVSGAVEDERMGYFSDATSRLSDYRQGSDDMQQFEQHVQNWTVIFAELLSEHGDTLLSKIEATDDTEWPAESTTEEGAIPLEAMFEEAEADADDVVDEVAAAAAASEVDSLVQQLDKREQSVPQRDGFTEEEQNRRRFLRDYVINEIGTFRDEIRINLPNLVDAGQHADARSALIDSLKGLQELGQIHIYPGIEAVAGATTDMVNSLPDYGSPNEEQLEHVDKLLDILPGYVDAALEEDDSGYLAQIEASVIAMGAGGEVEDVAVPELSETDEEVAVTEAPFQEMIDQYVRKISEALRTAPADEVAQQLTPTYENMIYWTEVKGVSGGIEAIQCLQSLTAAEIYPEIGSDEKQTILDIVASWENSFENTPVTDFENYISQFRAILGRYDSVDINESVQAFQDVTLRFLNDLVEAVEAQPADIGDVMKNRLREFVNLLQDNASLIRNDSLELFSRMMRIKLDSFDPNTIQDEGTVHSSLIGFLGNVHEQIAAIPQDVETEALLAQFDELVRKAMAVEDLAESTQDADVQDADDEALVDTEILEVFKLEALSYVNEMKDQVARLNSDLNDMGTWKNLGVTTHTLKGSAQMVQRDDITALAAPLNSSIELLEEGKLAIKPELLYIVESITASIRERLDGAEDADDAIVGELEQYLVANEIADPVAEPQSNEKPAVEGFIRLKEQDPELLDIFANEVSAHFDTVEKNLTNLEKFTYDKEALRESAGSVHEIRGAAKMLGITEIATITEKLHTVIEMLLDKEISDMKPVIPVTRRAMVVIRELTTNHTVTDEAYEEVLENINNLAEYGDEATLRESSRIFKVPEEFLKKSGDAAEEIPTEAAPAEGKKLPVTPQVLDLFIQEAHEQLDDINYLLLKLEKSADSADLQNHLMRCMHTLKGSAGMVYASQIETLSHRCEDIVEQFIKDSEPLPQDLFDISFRVVDEMNFILDSLEADGIEKTKNHADLIAALDGFAADAAPAELVTEDTVEEETVEEDIVEEDTVAAEVSTEPAVAEDEPVNMVTDDDEKGGRKETYLRLNINKMNHLLNLAAELVISNNQFKNQLSGLKNLTPAMNTNLKVFRDTEEYLSNLLRESKRLESETLEAEGAEAKAPELLKKHIEHLQQVLKNIKMLQDESTSLTHILKDNSKSYDENLLKLNKLSNELLDEIMQARLVPINLLFQRFHRPIRDIARKMKKQINLSIKGEETELDRTLIDELYEPLLHIIRNAIDHGLESPEERKKAGKGEEGLLEIKASRDRNQVIVDIRDDGRGIDAEAIKAAAIAKGLVSPEDAAKFSEQDAFDCMFYAGFSTAAETTTVSGRGVGLDVVKSQIEKSKGDIRVHTEQGKGTTFSIRVPISLSVIQSMLVEVNNHLYSVPLAHVEETLHVGVQDLLSEDDRYYIKYRERQIQVLQLSHLLKMPEDDSSSISSTGSYPVIIVQDDGQRLGLLVDKIIRREEILIKSLGPGLKRLQYISGGSIMADGQVVLVLDVLQILTEFDKSVAPATTEAISGENGHVSAEKEISPSGGKREKKHIQGRKPAALIVDDSLSIRKYLSSLLMQKGYVTDTARNGYEALELLNKQDFDIMVTDLEMPKLSGYELIETLRYDQRFTAFPIIVLTGRAGDNFRQLTTELGADAYIIKPFKDKELFDQIDKFIDHTV